MRRVLTTTALTALAAGLVVPPAFARPMPTPAPAPVARLAADITARSGHGDVTSYVVAVRAVGGTTRDTRVILTSPAAWAEIPAQCVPDSPDLVCPLGDVADRVELRVGLRTPVGLAGDVQRLLAGVPSAHDDDGLTAVVRAANAAETVATAPLVPVTETPSATAAAKAGAVEARPSVVVMQRPSVARPVQKKRKAHRKPKARTTVTRTVLVPQPAPAPQQIVQPVAVPQAPVQVLPQAAPPQIVQPQVVQPQVVPQQVVPQQPVPQVVPPQAPGGIPLPSAAGQNVALVPGDMPSAVPSAPSARPTGPPSLSMLSSADLDERGSWLTVLAIAVVAEVALLWFAAALGVWRRKLSLGNGYALPRPIRGLRRNVPRLIRSVRRR